MVRWGRSIAVRCCAEGYDNIRWYRKEASDWVHFPPVDKSSSITPKLEEKQQILRIYEADASDNTYFRCDLIKDGVSRKQHEMRLIVQRKSTFYHSILNCNDSGKGTFENIEGNEENTGNQHFFFLFPQCFLSFNPLPDEKILHWSKLKEIADDILKCIESKK